MSETKGKTLNIQSGITLLELAIALLIVVIVGLISVPTFNALASRNRVDSTISELTRKLLFARNHASNSLNYVTICPLVANQCGNNWNTGIDVFIDTDNNKQFNANDEMLAQGSPTKTGDDFVSAFTNGITFSPEGQISEVSTAIAFRYCSQDKRAGIKLSFNGYPKYVSSSEFSNCD